MEPNSFAFSLPALMLTLWLCIKADLLMVSFCQSVSGYRSEGMPARYSSRNCSVKGGVLPIFLYASFIESIWSMAPTMSGKQWVPGIRHTCYNLPLHLLHLAWWSPVQPHWRPVHHK